MEVIFFRVATALIKQGYVLIANNAWKLNAALVCYHLLGGIRVDTTCNVA